MGADNLRLHGSGLLDLPVNITPELLVSIISSFLTLIIGVAAMLNARGKYIEARADAIKAKSAADASLTETNAEVHRIVARKMSELDDRNQTAISKYEDAMGLVRTLEKTITAQADEIEEQSNQIIVLTSAAQKRDEANAKQADEIRILRIDMQTLQDANVRLVDENGILRNQLEELKDQFDAIQANLETMGKQLNDSAERERQYIETIATQKAQLDEKSRALETANARIAELEAEKEEESEALDDLRNQATRIQLQMETLKTEHEKLLKEFEERKQNEAHQQHPNDPDDRPTDTGVTSISTGTDGSAESNRVE